MYKSIDIVFCYIPSKMSMHWGRNRFCSRWQYEHGWCHVFISNFRRVDREKNESYVFTDEYWRCKREPGFNEMSGLPRLWWLINWLSINCNQLVIRMCMTLDKNKISFPNDNKCASTLRDSTSIVTLLYPLVQYIDNHQWVSITQGYLFTSSLGVAAIGCCSPRH